MRDARSTEIKKLLKKYYPNAQVKVRIHKYSGGESINVRTNAFKIEQFPDPTGYGYINRPSEQSQTNRDHIKSLLSSYQSIDRDEWGEILSGGNTYLFIDEL